MAVQSNPKICVTRYGHLWLHVATYAQLWRTWSVQLWLSIAWCWLLVANYAYLWQHRHMQPHKNLHWHVQGVAKVVTHSQAYRCSYNNWYSNICKQIRSYSYTHNHMTSCAKTCLHNYTQRDMYQCMWTCPRTCVTIHTDARTPTILGTYAYLWSKNGHVILYLQSSYLGRTCGWLCI